MQPKQSLNRKLSRTYQIKYQIVALAGLCILAMPLDAQERAAQDGLSDEEVTLNHVAAEVDHASAHPSTHNTQQTNSEYQTPLQRTDGLTTANMNDLGIETQQITQLRQDIAAGSYGEIDSLLILYKGELIAEDYWRDGAIDKPHFMFSITKNMLSNAIGKAIELGYIDSVNDPVIKYLSIADKEQLAPGTEAITLHDLLSMQSGISIPKSKTGDALPVITRENHASLYLSLTDAVSPGQTFKYQGADPDILNHVLYNTSGKDLAAFTDEHFFKPMAIASAHWETSVSGLTKASSGLHFTSRDLVKFGKLVIGEGRYMDKQLINSEWLHTATTPKTKNGKYGYFWWTENFQYNGKEIKTISARGARGQFLFVMPDLDLIVAVTSSNRGSQRRVPLQFVPEYIIPAFI